MLGVQGYSASVMRSVELNGVRQDRWLLVWSLHFLSQALLQTGLQGQGRVCSAPDSPWRWD